MLPLKHLWDAQSLTPLTSSTPKARTLTDMLVLGAKRISRDTEDSTALERQGLWIEGEVAKRGDTLVHMVTDATVSGAVNLFDRPALGEWLKEPLVLTWEALMVTAQDRISRDDLQWWEFISWVLKNGKTIIVLDDPSFDITTTTGRTIAGFKAGVAADYREKVKDKVQNQRIYYRTKLYWPGGTWPFGYHSKKVDVEGENDPKWRLFVDETSAAYDHEAWDRIVNMNHSLSDIVVDWNQRGVLTSHDYQRHVNAMEKREGRKSKLKKHVWGTTGLKYILRNQALRGYAMHKKEVLTDADGLPIRWADPVFDDEEWERLQAVLDQRAVRFNTTKTTRTRKTDPYVGVIYCQCGLKHHTSGSTADGKRYEYYQCSSRDVKDGKTCPHARSWTRVFLRDFLEEEFLRELGDTEVIKRTFVPGKDHTAKIKDIESAQENLALAIAQAQSAAVIGKLTETMDRHETTLTSLRAEPVTPASWEETRTGETYGQWWERSSPEDRGRLLRDTGIRLYVGGTQQIPNFRLYVPEDLAARAQGVTSGQVDSLSLEGWAKTVQEAQQGR